MATTKAEATPARAAAKKPATTRTRTRTRRTAKAKPTVEPMVIEYGYSRLTLRKVVYEATSDEHFGADKQYIAKDALGNVEKDADAPKRIRVTIEVIE